MYISIEQNPGEQTLNSGPELKAWMKKHQRRPGKLLNSSVSPHPPSVIGPKMTRLHSIPLPVVTDEMTSLVSGCPDESTTCHLPSRKRKSQSSPMEASTAGSHPGSRKRTSSAKSTPYRTSSQTIPCSMTSAADSSTSVMGSRGFWNRSKEDWSTKLWLPTRIDSPDSAPSSLNGVSNEYFSSFSIKRHSHPQKKSLKTLWQSYTYSLVGSMAKEDTLALRLAARRERSVAYKGLDADQRKQRKRQFEADQVPGV